MCACTWQVDVGCRPAKIRSRDLRLDAVGGWHALVPMGPIAQASDPVSKSLSRDQWRLIEEPVVCPGACDLSESD